MFASLIDPLRTVRSALCADAEDVDVVAAGVGASAFGWLGLLGSIGRKKRQPVAATTSAQTIETTGVRRANIVISVRGLGLVPR